ncbi:anti-repressor SinI family protein [Bacillus sp. H-16]|nr:anti-repressor SinI family protein [Alteribacter salitolerans]MBM7097062.1 anti-repressor SinI family protein [Alteribacter salitolerans]
MTAEPPSKDIIEGRISKVAVTERAEQWYDEEWEALIKEALELGLSKEEIRSFLTIKVHKEKIR